MQPDRLTHIPTARANIRDEIEVSTVGSNHGYVDKALNWDVKKT